ncbi:MAG: hypothetical protein H0Z32_15880 [Bacillaceae bacterium]|nr:hypothetical protein [Bacillaceae bacterium]
MNIDFHIIDEENDLEKGNFAYFYASEMELSISNNRNSIVFNTTMHKTFLITLFSEISNLYSSGKPFIISTYGNAKEYSCQFIHGGLQIIEIDKLIEKSTLQIAFDKYMFYSKLKDFYKRYLQYLKKKNKNITKEKQYIFLDEQYKKLF